MKRFKILFLGITAFLFASIFVGFVYSCGNDEANNDASSVQNNSTELARFVDEQKIGEESDGTFTITADKDDLLENFNELANEQGLGEVTFTTLEIKKDIVVDSNPQEYFYALYATDANYNHKAAISLTILDRVLYSDVEGGTITCTSTDCGTGCTPYQAAVSGGKVWSCSTCIGSGKCTKSASLSI